MHPTQEDSKARERQSRPTIPDTVAGNWRAELLGGDSLHLAGTVNPVPAPHAIEFSFMTLPTCAYGPSKIVLPALIVLMPPPEQVQHADVGGLIRNGPAAMIDLFVTRPYSRTPRLQSGREQTIAFKVEDGAQQNGRSRCGT